MRQASRQTLRAWFIFVALVLVVHGIKTVPITAMERAHAAYRSGDYATAAGRFRRLAEEGNADAQYFLGGMYHVGRGVAEEQSAALDWYRLAAEQGHTYAQNSLALMYSFGFGTARDPVEAMKWLQTSAELGNVDAQVRLSNAYRDGRDVAVDKIKAMMWYIIAEVEAGPCMSQNYRITMPVEGMTGADVSEAKNSAKAWLQKYASTRRKVFQNLLSCD